MPASSASTRGATTGPTATPISCPWITACRACWASGWSCPRISRSTTTCGWRGRSSPGPSPGRSCCSDGLHTGRQDGLLEELEAHLLSQGRAARFGGSVGWLRCSGGLGKGDEAGGSLLRPHHAPLPPSRLIPKLGCPGGFLLDGGSVATPCDAFSGATLLVSPQPRRGAGGNVGAGSLAGTPGWPCPAPLGVREAGGT